MRKHAINAMMGVVVIAVFSLAGCGSGGGTSTGVLPATTAGAIEHVGWFFDNVSADLTTNETCVLNVSLYYSSTVSKTDIVSFDIVAPTGTRWSIPAANAGFGKSGSGKPYIGAGLYYGQNPNLLPLAGTWTATLALKNGATSSLQFTLHEPGSTATATHQYLYTKEDWTPSTNQSQYVAALSRFPSQGYTLQYSATNSGEITSTGLATAMSSYLAAEPKAYNMYCWLFDASDNYLGYTIPQYSTMNHASTGLITGSGELLITPASTVSSTEAVTVDLSAVKYVRFLYLDGAQYVPSSYGAGDQRSVSAKVAVY